MILQLNSTLGIEQLASWVWDFFKIASTFLGGIFGLYFIMTIFKIINDRKLVREIQLIRLKHRKSAYLLWAEAHRLRMLIFEVLRGRAPGTKKPIGFLC